MFINVTVCFFEREASYFIIFGWRIFIVFLLFRLIFILTIIFISLIFNIKHLTKHKTYLSSSLLTYSPNDPIYS